MNRAILGIGFLVGFTLACGGSNPRTRVIGTGGAASPSGQARDESATLRDLASVPANIGPGRIIHTESETYTTYITPDGVPYCQKEGSEPWFSLSFESPGGAGHREARDGRVRAQMFGRRAEFEFFGR